MEEQFDILDASGAFTGVTAPRSRVHSEGLLHRAVHVWLFARASGELLLQRRAACKDSWAGFLDISSAGHVSAGGESRMTALRELEEELGVALPAARFRFLFTHFEEIESVQRGRRFLNNEFNDVYLIEISPAERAALDANAAVVRALPDGWAPATDAEREAPLRGFLLQESEVSAVEWVPVERVRNMMEKGDGDMVPCSKWESYKRLFEALAEEKVDTAH